jgi:hypothetical protein
LSSDLPISAQIAIFSVKISNSKSFYDIILRERKPVKEHLTGIAAISLAISPMRELLRSVAVTKIATKAGISS